VSWSHEQLQAIELRDKNLLVAAAAGSGKTSVLVERIIRRVLDERNPLDVDKLLVATFTNAAAAEMRERIANALAQALKTKPNTRHLERQLVLLNSASISTIHAFCQNIVRQNFHLLDLDPNFRVAGEAEVNLIKHEVLENLFEEKYNSGDADFLGFVEHYGDDHNDQVLYDLVLNLYSFSRSHPWPEHWLAELQQSFQVPESMSIDDTPWSGLIRDKIILELDQARLLLTKLSREAALPGNPDAYIDVFQADRGLIDSLTEAASCSWEKLCLALEACTFAKLPPVKGLDEAAKKYFQKGRQTVKDKVSDFQQVFFNRPAAELLADMRLTAPVVSELGSLVNAFAAAFTKAKLTKSLLDFNDLEHFCLKILLDESAAPGEIKPSPVAAALQRKYAEIMVDEYQDTNGVQETILALVAKPDQPNLFLVGDIKQSIYRFRLAEPELFLEKYRQYPLRGQGYARVDLARNFRSRAGILQGINFLFSQLMAPRVAELEYGEAERLNPGPDYPATDKKTVAGPIELCIVDRDSAGGDQTQSDGSVDCESEGETSVLECSGFELEARLIAARINELMSSGSMVFDKETKQYRQLAWRDIVILLRSVKNKANVLLEVLRQVNIPVYAEIDSGYFREIEVQIMLSLLSIIDNPRQDIHLAGVLRSPLVGLSAVELAKIRLIQRGGDLWSALVATACADHMTEEAELQTKVAQFVSQLTKWRSFSRRKGVPELIWQLYRDTGYYDYVGGMPGGTLRQANLRALYDRSRQYEATNFRGLFRFLRFIERMQSKGTDLAVARALGESEDVVRIMSIHKSKGLEFPVVFVADLGKNINLADSKALVLTHKKLGVGPYVTNPALRFRYPTLARYGIAYKLNMETRAEELRILYVALTRAREKLILVGSASKIDQKIANWCQSSGHSQQTLPDSLIAGAKSYLDWLCPAIARHADGQVLRDSIDGCEQPCSSLAQNDSEWLVRIYSRDELSNVRQQAEGEVPFLSELEQLAPVAGGAGADWVERLLDWKYPQTEVVGKPAKLSVSEIKRRFELVDSDHGEKMFERPPIITRPRFIQAAGKLTAAEYGTIMHTVMQHVDTKGDLTEAGLQAQVQSLIDREILLTEQAAAVDIAGVVQFYTAELGQRICHSSKVRRELPFSLMLSAERFYPELAGMNEKIFVQGVIDTLFEEPDGLVLVDYKTDKGQSAAELAAKYAVQLELYAEAVQTIFKQPVKEKYLYIFSTAEVIRM